MKNIAPSDLNAGVVAEIIRIKGAWRAWFFSFFCPVLQNEYRFAHGMLIVRQVIVGQKILTLDVFFIRVADQKPIFNPAEYITPPGGTA